MKSRTFLAALFLGAALVLASAQSADAFGCFNRGGCGGGCEPSCGFEPACGCELDCCDTGCDRPGLLQRLCGLLHRDRGCDCCEVSCCEPSCCVAEPTCCAPEPSCCVVEPSCGCEADCCEESCCAPRCRLLERIGGLFRRGGCGGGCGDCGCEPSCGFEPSCGCN